MTQQRNSLDEVSLIFYYINVKSPNLDLKQGISFLERERGQGVGGREGERLREGRDRRE
jgi:hypothetical protein